MTEREAWLFLGRAFANACTVFANDFVFVASFRVVGLCGAVSAMCNEKLISHQVHLAMGRRLDEEIVNATNLHLTSYLFPTNKAGHTKRAALCRQFARRLKK